MPIEKGASKIILGTKPPGMKKVVPKVMGTKTVGEEPKRRAALEEIGNKTDAKHAQQTKTNLIPQKTSGNVKATTTSRSTMQVKAIPKARKPLATVVVPYTEAENQSNIENVDEEDEENIYLLGVYVNDIYAHLLKLEESSPIRSGFLDGSIVTGRMRALLVDWIFEIHEALSLLPETAQMSIAIVDRYFQIDKTVTTSNLQLIGAASLFLAAKYEEIYPPSLSDLVESSDNSFTKKDIISMELKLVKALDYKFGRPVPITFLRRFTKVTKSKAIHHIHGKYFIELALMDITLSSVKPSLIAAAALYMAHFVVGNYTAMKPSLWTPTIAHYSKYKFMNFRKIIPLMACAVTASATSSLKSVRHRFSSAKQKGVSLSPALQPKSKVLEALLKF